MKVISEKIELQECDFKIKVEQVVLIFKAKAMQQGIELKLNN